MNPPDIPVKPGVNILPFWSVRQGKWLGGRQGTQYFNKVLR
jgi:hypothetical protein